MNNKVGNMSIKDALSKIRHIGVGFGGVTSGSEEMIRYLSYYEMPSMDQFDYLYGFIPFRGGRIWAILVSPKDLRINGTVVVVHGYQSHAGDQKNVARKYLDEGKAVILFDLPGHGLSLSESRLGECHINDFSEYVDALEAVLGRVRGYTSGPLTFFGHSQAFAVLAKYSRGRKNIDITTFAPMERLGNWFFVRILAMLPIKKIVGIKANVSSDKSYNEFAKGDPLQSKVLTIDWLRAAIRFHLEFVSSEAYDPSVRVTVIQGTKDGIVDWKYNMLSIPNKMPSAVVRLIPEANHQLQNESEELREKIFFI